MKTYYIGDIHGKWDKFQRLIDINNLTDCRIICIGDLGVGFVPRDQQIRVLDSLNRFFINRRINFSSIRGNHDDPSYFTGTTLFSHLFLIPDYSYSDSRLFIGGGISIDRFLRKEGRDYWRDEAVKRIKLPDYDVDIIVCHTFPLNIIKSAYQLWDAPGNPVKSDCISEGEYLTTVWEKYRPKLWIGGHHHISKTELVNGTKFTCLNELEIQELII